MTALSGSPNRCAASSDSCADEQAIPASSSVPPLKTQAPSSHLVNPSSCLPVPLRNQDTNQDILEQIGTSDRHIPDASPPPEASDLSDLHQPTQITSCCLAGHIKKLPIALIGELNALIDHQG